MTTVFLISDVVAGKNAASTRSIFGDVEAAKRKVFQTRRSSKRRLDDASTAERQSQLALSQTETGSLSQVANASKALLQAESDLIEVSATRTALERRRRDLFLEISTLTSSLSKTTSLDSTDHSTGKHENAPSGSRHSGIKIQKRYFETDLSKSVADVSTDEIQRESSSRESEVQEDLSTVVCPFELMGSCTDPICAYMHLNR
jgi:hypothetical protein